MNDPNQSAQPASAGTTAAARKSLPPVVPADGADLHEGIRELQEVRTLVRMLLAVQGDWVDNVDSTAPLCALACAALYPIEQVLVETENALLALERGLRLAIALELANGEPGDLAPGTDGTAPGHSGSGE